MGKIKGRKNGRFGKGGLVWGEAAAAKKQPGEKKGGSLKKRRGYVRDPKKNLSGPKWG